GTLNLRHPTACQALVDAAAAAGATVVRGVRDVKVAAGSSPTVACGVNGQPLEFEAQLVVGADGRASTVRKQSGIELERPEPISWIAGILLDDLEGVPEVDTLCSDGDVFFLMFHQGNGRARSYIASGMSTQQRFAGADKTQKYFDACKAVSCYPWVEQVLAA